VRSRWHLRANALVAVWLLAAAVVAIAHRWVPSAEWLMVHLLLLGGVSTAILVWSAHFAEALRRHPLPGGYRGQAARIAGHTIGSIGVLVGLVGQRPGLLTAGSVAVGAATVWHGGVLVVHAKRGLGTPLGWTAWYYVAAAAALPVGAGFGVVLAQAGGELASRAYVGHVAVMLLGWVGLTVVGTLVSLWPTMLGTGLGDDSLAAARQGFVVLCAAIAGQVLAVLTGARWLLVAALVVYAAGLVRTSWPLAAQARMRSPHSFAARSVGAAQLWLVGSVLVWAVVSATAPSWAQAEQQFAALLGPLAGGFAGQVLLGSLCHLGPMILGGGPSAVRAARAVVERGAGARLVLLNGGLVLFALPAPSLVRVTASTLALGAALWTFGLILAAVLASRRARATAPSGPTTVRPAELLAAARHRAPRGSGVAAGVALLLAVALSVGTDPAAVGLGAAADGGVPASGKVVEVEVEARDMRFSPSEVTVAAGDELVLVVTNVDSTVHDLVLDSGASSGRIAPGETARLELGVVGRSMDGWCSIAGHRQMGMVFAVVVEGGPEDHGGHAAGSDQVDGPGFVDLNSDPPSGFEAFDATLAPAPAGNVHRHTLTVGEQVLEVAPGVTQTLWTYNGQVPGPTLRGKVGDRFEITLVNDGTLGHSIDFHAGALAPNEPMRTIEPGESLTYSFTATRSGIWMYHCSTMPMTLHIANGMFGAVVIDPPDLPEVDREYLLVQSEYYLGPDGEIADSAKILAESPDAVVFNGYANQYGHEPLEARVGERVRFWVLDVGPNRPSSFHIVGGQFDTVYAEGGWLIGGPHGAGGDPTGGSQVLGLMPAQGGFVELEFPEAGHYALVSHLMLDAERGAHGIVRVTD